MMKPRSAGSTIAATSVGVLTIAVVSFAFLTKQWRRKRLQSEDEENEFPIFRRRVPVRQEDAKSLQPLQVNGMLLKNRVIRAAAFGGCQIDDLIRTHGEVVQGGAAMTTVAYASVSADGRTFESQLLLVEDDEENSSKIISDLLRLTRAVHSVEGAKISIQLTHAGSFADPKVTGKQSMAPSALFEASNFAWSRPMSRDDMDRVAHDFARAAQLAKMVGFDAIELHCGHGYLLSQFLCPRTNSRTDGYGGPQAKHRVRFPVQVLTAIRQAVGPTFPIFVKMNVHDGFSSGITLDDAVYFARAFAAASADCLVLSGGFVSRNGFYMLRGRTPLWSMAKAMGLWSVKGLAVLLLGRWLVPEMTFEECFFRDRAKHILDKLRQEKTDKDDGCNRNTMACLLGGITSLSAMEGAMDDGFALIQMARALIQNPNFVNDVSNSLSVESCAIEDVRSSCNHCNECVVSTLDPKTGMQCPLKWQ